jgi:hypothetical protein
MQPTEFVELAKDCLADAQYADDLRRQGLTSLDVFFSFTTGKQLSKPNLASYRSRLQFELGPGGPTVFLKRYDRPGRWVQLRNWLTHGRRGSTMSYELRAAEELRAAGIGTSRAIAFGERWGLVFEKKSFICTEKIPQAESLERELPDYFCGPASADCLRRRRLFIHQLAVFARRFHQTGYRHRDFYFAHIFYGRDGGFYLIDLQRAFRPTVFGERFCLKDIAQLYYSAPKRYFSRTDRLRFYLAYAGRRSLQATDKVFIRKVISKVRRMARHDARHGRTAPFSH